MFKVQRYVLMLKNKKRLNFLWLFILIGQSMMVRSQRSFSIVWMHESKRTTRRLKQCVIITTKASSNQFTASCKLGVMLKNWK